MDKKKPDKNDKKHKVTLGTPTKRRNEYLQTSRGEARTYLQSPRFDCSPKTCDFMLDFALPPPKDRADAKKIVIKDWEKIDLSSLVLNKEKVLWPYGIMDLRDLFWGLPWKQSLCRVEKLIVADVPFDTTCRRDFLRSLPECTSLQSLDVSRTGATTADFKLLLRSVNTRLKTLIACGNDIKAVGTAIAPLTKLKTLNLSGCSLEYLTYHIGLLDKTDLMLHPNLRLLDPPVEIQKKGAKDIRKWLLDEKNWFKGRRVNLFVIGHSEAGKTSLLSTLNQLKTSGQADLRVLIEQQLKAGAGGSAGGEAMLQSTVGVDKQYWKIGSGDFLAYSRMADSLVGLEAKTLPPMELNVFDFAGQLEYLTTHKFFLSPVNTIYLIVTDASQSLEQQKRKINYWLDLLVSKLRPYDAEEVMGFGKYRWSLLLVSTKVDLVPNKEILKKGAEELYAHTCQRLKAFNFESELFLVSNKDGTGVKQLLHKILEIAEAMVGQSAKQDTTRSRLMPRLLGELETVVKHFVEKRRFLVSMKELRAFTCNGQGCGVCEPGRSGVSVSQWGDWIWSRCLGELRAQVVLLGTTGSDMICVQPQLVSKAMALFISPLSHKIRIMHALQKPLFGGAVVKTEDAIARLGTLPELSSLSVTERVQVLKFMEEIDLCFELDAKARETLGYAGFLFPSLRPHGELFLLPPNPDKTAATRFLGKQLRFPTDYITSEVFFHLQVLLRHMVDLSFKLFTNAMVLTLGENRALASLTKEGINVVCSGPAPLQIMQDFMSAKDRALDRIGVAGYHCAQVTLCPRCAQGIGTVSVLDMEAFKCERGHSFTAAQANAADPIDPVMQRLNNLWAPRKWELFLTQGDWKTTAGNLRYSDLSYTSPKSELDVARNEEFIRAKDLFYKFVSRDSLSNFELDKVTFLDNPQLESVFRDTFVKHVGRAMKSVDEEVFIAGDDTSRSWRDWVVGQFNSYAAKVGGMQGINLVAGWHGTSPELCMKIAEGNFLEPHELEVELAKIGKKMTDPGYFGKGIYFTQFPSYGAQYAKHNALLLSWIIMGRVYPVIEQPAVNDPNSLLGKGCKTGFDSHYAVVKRAGNTYIPCPPPGAQGHAPPDYDEMVVFSKTQILPRYILHYHIVDTVKKTDGTAGTAVHASNVLWVDDKGSGEHSSLLASWASEKQDVFYGSFTSTEELRVWLNNRSQALTALGAEVRIITNRFRERDGGEAAAENLCKFVRTESAFPRAKILIFCKNMAGLTHLEDSNTYISDDIAFCQQYGLFNRLETEKGDKEKEKDKEPKSPKS